MNNSAIVADEHTIGTGKLALTPNKSKLLDSNAAYEEENRDAELLASLFDSKLGRAILRITQKGVYVRGFELFPDYTEFKRLLADDGRVHFSDTWGYERLEFSEELIAHVERTISKKPTPEFWDESTHGEW